MARGRHTSVMNFERITLRRAGNDDARALATLAELDSQRLPDDEVLIGEVAGGPWAAVRPKRRPAENFRVGGAAGEPWAALGIPSGILVADPYRPTVELAGLLRMRAKSMRGAAAAQQAHGRWRDAPKPLP